MKSGASPLYVYCAFVCALRIRLICDVLNVSVVQIVVALYIYVHIYTNIYIRETVYYTSSVRLFISAHVRP